MTIVNKKSLSEESVIVVMDANRNKGSCSNVDALDWALNHVVRPKDTVLVIGIFCEYHAKKSSSSSSSSSSCFPFYSGNGISAIWEKLEFSGQGEMTSKVLEEEIDKKREQYQCTLQPFYRQCNKNEVKLEVKLAAGFDPKGITIEEAQKANARWIVLDSHLKKHKAFIYEKAGCNVAAMKEKDVATISLSRAGDDYDALLTQKFADIDLAVQPDKPQTTDSNILQPDEAQNEDSNILQEHKLWESPLSWRSGFPRKFTHSEIESITNGFASVNIILVADNMQLYQGVLMDAPVLVKCFFNDDERFWSELKTLSRIRHRNISNLVGYCCTDVSMFLIRDYLSIDSLDVHLQCDELAKNLTWKERLNIAEDIGSCLRYLYEDCLDGPIVPQSVSSSHILFSHGCSMMLTELVSANGTNDYSASIGGFPMTTGFNKCQTMNADQLPPLDVHAYGLFLLELLTGRRTNNFEDAQSLVDWAMPLLENGCLSQIVDPRLVDSNDTKEVRDMASAVLICLRSDSGRRPSVNEVLAQVRGDRCGALYF